MTPQEKQWLKSAAEPEKLHRQIRTLHILAGVEAGLIILSIAVILCYGFEEKWWVVTAFAAMLLSNGWTIYNCRQLLKAAERLEKENGK